LTPLVKPSSLASFTFAYGGPASDPFIKEIRHPHHMALDTTHLPPQDAARRIVEQCGL
jgi:hypothetical protein